VRLGANLFAHGVALYRVSRCGGEFERELREFTDVIRLDFVAGRAFPE
jgi:hypothetical protein